MDDNKHTVLIVDDEKLVLNSLRRTVRDTDYNFKFLQSGQEAINYLKEYHTSTAMVICDYGMPGVDGSQVLLARNDIDKYLPFFILSGIASTEHVHNLLAKNLSGYLVKTVDDKRMSDLIDSVLIKRIDFSKKVKSVLHKLGGSADDHLRLTGEHNVREILELIVELQNGGEFNHIVTFGAGQRGDIIKDNYKTLERSCPGVRNSFPKDIVGALEDNANFYVNVMGSDNAVHITPEDMLKNWDSLDDLFDTNKVIVMSTAPRHLGLSKGTDRSHPNYPNVPLEDSDAHSVLLAELFQIPHIGLIKRTDSVYSFDPYKGLKSDDMATWTTEQIDSWVEAQKTNVQLDPISCEELISESTIEGENVSRIGTWDGKGGHFFETSALELMLKSDVVETINVIHVDPKELYPEGRHVCTNKTEPPEPHWDIDYILGLLREIPQGKCKRGLVTKHPSISSDYPAS